MKFVTVATHDSGFFSIYMQSCHRHGIKPDVLGFGQPWRGFSWRFDLMIEFLTKLDPKELVMFTDAYDVIFLQGADEIERRYLQLVPNRDKILIAEDYTSNNIISKYYYYAWYFGTCEGHRLNAGTYMGPAAMILDAIKSIKQMSKSQKSADDQVMMTKHCSLHPEIYVIDRTRYIFHICLKEKHCYAGITNACVLHGAANTDLTKISKQLGYDTSRLKIRRRYVIQRVASYIKHFQSMYPLAVYSWAILSIFVAVFVLRQIKMQR